ncbi:MAG: sulfate reduction electron transfer complex DsrMKJOP subunit DsrK [Nitrospinota bacterium]
MSDEKIEAPILTGSITVPKIKENASVDQKCHYAAEKHMEKLGFPSVKPVDWKEKALKKMKELLKKYRSLKLYLDICVRCGSCADKCHYFLGTGDPKNMPVARQELLRKVYKKYFTVEGKVLGGLTNAEELTDEVLEEWYTYFHQCSQCRRCSVFCPYGIDTAEISMAAREIMDSIGVGQKYCNEVLGKVYDIGNNLGMPGPALRNTLDFFEEDIQETTGVDVKLPLDVEGAEVLLVSPSADFFSSPHVDSLVGYAKVFHKAGISWTLSSYASEFANFGMFIGSYSVMKKVATRILDEARRLKVKRIIVGECGHAWRVAYSFWNTLIGPFDFLDPRYPAPQHICEFTLDLVNRGAIKLDKSANDEFTVTYHDSCNVARATRMGDKPGGQFEIPRALIRASCNKFFEMPDNVNRERTFCCGGGGGLLTEELMDLRVKGTQPKAQALKDLMENHQVNLMVMICAICKAHFTHILPYYDIPMEAVGGIHQLIGRAIVL